MPLSQRIKPIYPCWWMFLYQFDGLLNRFEHWLAYRSPAWMHIKISQVDWLQQQEKRFTKWAYRRLHDCKAI